MLQKIFISFAVIVLLAACTAPAQQTSEVSETSEVSTLTPAPTETPTLTPTPTQTSTPEPTATPEPETVDIDVNGDGTPDYKGILKESHNVEVTEGENARVEYITINYETGKDLGYAQLYTGQGYLTGYDIVAVQNPDGGQSVNWVRYRIKYFRKNLPPITIQFTSLEKLLRNVGDFDGESSLGSKMDINCWLPTNSNFSESVWNATKKYSKLSDFELELLYPKDANWLRAKDLVDILRYSEEEFVDLQFKVSATQMLAK